jgi:PAS domain S-box-containing protein
MAHSESSRQFRLLAENASDFVVQASLDGVISWVSPSVSRTLEWAPSDLMGTQLAGLVHPDDAEGMPSQREAGSGGHETTAPVGTFVVRMLTKSGEHRWMSGVATPVADESGVEVGVVSGLRDVDELVRAREAAQADRAALRATVDSLLDPHIVLDAIRDETGHIVDFVYVDANPAACVYNKLDRAEMVGTRLLDLFGGHAGTETLEAYRQVVETGEPIRLDDVVYTHEILEAERRYDIRAARVGDGLSLTWRDVTDRYAAAQRLAASEEQYRVLAENASDVVMRLGPQLRFEWVSGSVAHVLGWQAPDLVGHLIGGFVHPEDRPRFLQAFTDAAPGSAAGVEFRFRRSDGGYRWVACRARVDVDEDGTPVAVVGGLVDIADRKAAEAKELQRLEELERFQRITVGRELKMIELKKEIEYLKKLVPADGADSRDPSRETG